MTDQEVGSVGFWGREKIKDHGKGKNTLAVWTRTNLTSNMTY